MPIGFYNCLFQTCPFDDIDTGKLLYIICFVGHSANEFYVGQEVFAKCSQTGLIYFATVQDVLNKSCLVEFTDKSVAQVAFTYYISQLNFDSMLFQ
jgi:hypothetical protein